MIKKLIFLVATLFCTSNPEVYKQKYNYSLSMIYEINTNALTCSALVLSNGKKVTCLCGRDPLLIMIMYGHIQGFCWMHLPTINANIGLGLRDEHDEEAITERL